MGKRHKWRLRVLEERIDADAKLFRQALSHERAMRRVHQRYIAIATAEHSAADAEHFERLNNADRTAADVAVKHETAIADIHSTTVSKERYEADQVAARERAGTTEQLASSRRTQAAQAVSLAQGQQEGRDRLVGLSTRTVAYLITAAAGLIGLAAALSGHVK